MNFASPQFLFILAALPALALFARWVLARRAAAMMRIGDPALVERLSATSQRMRLIRLALWFVGVALISRRSGKASMGDPSRDRRAAWAYS